MTGSVQAARTPRTLWVELTSKCPFDCVFCSRKLRRGAGQHLPFELYEALVRDLVDPRKFVLNYSGESTLYPDLIPAIRLARSTGASAELVSVMATASEATLGPLSESGLNRLTVSVHATADGKFEEVYRHSSFATLRSRLEYFLDHCRAVAKPTVVDLAFVAMDTNLSELAPVAALAQSFGLRDIFIFPVMRRDGIPAHFPTELTVLGHHQAGFEGRVRAMVDCTAARHPEIRFTICNESFTVDDHGLGEVPVPYPRELPPGACVHSCEQNPWETAHVLSNGDVVACEVLDKIPLGNLFHHSIAQIWTGDPYRQFRERYRQGKVAECRSCPWKRAYRPAPLSSEIVASRGGSAQLLHGWHEADGQGHIWSSQQAVAIVAARNGSRTLHVCALLPPGLNGIPNELTIRLNGTEVGKVANPSEDVIHFGLDFALEDRGDTWIVEFRTTHVFRPDERGVGTDQRDLGFALVLLASQEFVDRERIISRRDDLLPLIHWIRIVDRLGRCAPRRRRPSSSEVACAPGLSIVVPERDNVEELTSALASVRDAALLWHEPVETIVIVNGSPPAEYESLRRTNPDVRWKFYVNPLGFTDAVRAGLQDARYDWVYLLNNDAMIDPDALRALAPCRDSAVFSIGSQIFLKDRTRFRDETNWGALLIESGLATIHDWVPKSGSPVPSFYTGGGASLFQARLLRSFLDASAYAPFYWEDVEWGWRARKLGYESVFCPASVAHHSRRSTIGRHYRNEEIELIIRRNRLLFQLRNFTTAGSLERVMDEISRSPDPVASYFLRPRTRWSIARGRIWNYRAPFTDDEVFARWNSSISNS